MMQKKRELISKLGHNFFFKWYIRNDKYSSGSDKFIVSRGGCTVQRGNPIQEADDGTGRSVPSCVGFVIVEMEFRA